MTREAIYMTGLPEGVCHIHAWPTENLAARLVSAMRLMHGKGGVNVCVECVHRAHADARARVERRRGGP